jgi:chloramphenicol O-acetyltransferase type A
MRYIDMQNWPRREHFKVFSAFDHPHFSMCANVDLTELLSAVKQHGYSITVAIVYVISRSANEIPEFRYRIRAEKVVEHDFVHPATTILTDQDLFSFCTIIYDQDFSLFAARAEEEIAFVQEHPTLESDPELDDRLYMTAIPWVSFTSFMHPMHLQPADSVPRFAWGKFFKDGEFLRMPLEVQAHHALMDGVHMGQFYLKVQDLMHHPDFITGAA